MNERPSNANFAFDGQVVRVNIDDAGELWFAASDVCAALATSTPWCVLSHRVDAGDLAKRPAIDALGRSRLMVHINESGVHSLVQGSKLPTAKRFMRRVNFEVLSRIHRAGKPATAECYEALPGVTA